MDIFAKRLREIRVENELTQKQLAELLQTTDDSIYSWEKGRSQPSIETLRKICVALNVSADYLIGVKTDA
jgi:transcriptional regulator with XRE-family HTH domain